MVKIQCACGKRFNVPEKFRGQQGRCPNCATIIIVPNDDEEILSFAESSPTYDAEALFEKVIDTVVGISDDGRLFGSGFFINNKGLIVTNRHVIGTANKVKVRLYGGSEQIGELIRSYKDIDLAFLRVPTKNNTSVATGTQAKLKIGQGLFAIGHPMGLENTITQGIVSATNREISGTDYIQTDASVNPGNSGGPLFNNRAQVIGMNTMILSQAQGLGFALPIDLIKSRYRAIKQELAGVFTMEYCGICGKNSRDLHYCEHCGVVLDDVQPVSTINRKVLANLNVVPGIIEPCAVCKSMVSYDETYCPFCGVTLALGD